MFPAENYGENSFPSALFLKLDPLKCRDNIFPTLKESTEKSDHLERIDKQEEVLGLKENTWINNLINDWFLRVFEFIFYHISESSIKKPYKSFSYRLSYYWQFLTFFLAYFCENELEYQSHIILAVMKIILI